MKALFREIRAGDVDAVRRRVAADPGLVHATSRGAPKKDDGQSPLQVAIKTGHVEIAHLLLDHGSDVGFMEESAVNAWRVPVVHDAVRAAVMSSRYLRKVGWDPAAPQWEPANTEEHADAAYGLLRRVVEAGADLQREDSFGNRALTRFVLDARDVLPTVHHGDPTWTDPMPLGAELDTDLRRISDLLLAHGADPDLVDPELGASPAAFYAAEPVVRYLRRPAG